MKNQFWYGVFIGATLGVIIVMLNMAMQLSRNTAMIDSMQQKMHADMWQVKDEVSAMNAQLRDFELVE